MWADSFQGKSFIVTGAGRSIGRAITKALDAAGATVYAVARTPDNLASLKAECQRVEVIAVDLADWDATKAAIEKIPPVDGLVNNAGVIEPGNFMTLTPVDLDAMYAVNLRGHVNVSQVVAAKMIERGAGGTIVNMSSTAGLKSPNFVSGYSMLKVALQQMTKLMTVELGPHNIRVNAICPGCVTDTDMVAHLLETLPGVPDGMARFVDRYAQLVPTKREFVALSEVVNMTLFYLSDMAPSITGSITPIDGGFSVC